MYYFLNDSFKQSPLKSTARGFQAFLTGTRPNETLNSTHCLDGKTLQVLERNNRKCYEIQTPSSSGVGVGDRNNVNERLLHQLTRTEFEEYFKFNIGTMPSGVYINSTKAAASKIHQVLGSRHNTGGWLKACLLLQAYATFHSKREQRRELSLIYANRELSSVSLPRYQKKVIRAYGSNSDGSEPLYKTKTGYYDILDVSVNATNAQIKTAYYKQSFVFHPDKNAGGEVAILRFSEISEAYHVLGNKALRRKYDRGILSHSDVIGAGKPSVTDTSPSASQPTRKHSPAVGMNSQDIFNFDNFIKSHYSDQLQRDKDVRERKEDMQRKRDGTKEWELGKMMEMTVGLLLVTALVILVKVK